MDPSTTILRVKRKRGTDPADALLLACKRIRPETTSQTAGETVPEPDDAEVENSVFKLVATVASQDAPVQTQVREALARPRMAHALRPSGSSQRIVGDLRSVKWSTRREERYRILSSHRAGMPAEQPPSTQPEPTEEEPGKNPWSLGEVQVFDIIQEDGDQDKAPSKLLTPDPETILCNSTKMLSEKLSVSGVGVEHREREDDYVYDLYYQETVAAGWIQDILSVRSYADEGELVPDFVVNEEVYEDENEEGNWRNDYPDEDGSDREERYGGYSYSRRSWDQYQVIQELDDDDGDEDDSD